ncbi:MAG TPA: Fur family transcriptional regulator [Fimbriimonadaceae bacterium]|nr:Fur family transcriptional regulator [Fimbriimonadaceae bacterium]
MKERRTREPQLACNHASPEEARSFEELALKELREAGYRITMPRVQVIRALGESNKALSAYAIHERIISTGGKIDVVSVYRILATLQEVGLIHHIGVVDGYFACRQAGADRDRSEHLICESCGCVTELSLPTSIVATTEEQAQKAGFKVTNLKVEILGKCTHCQGKA